METGYPSYLRLLDELNGKLEQLTALARQKEAAVQQDNLLALDEVLKQEQAYGLSLRGMEQKRTKLVRELGLEGTVLSDLCERCPADLRAQAKQTADRLLRTYAVYQRAAQRARNTLECNLAELGGLVTELGGAEQPPETPEPPPRMKTDFRA